MLLVAFGQQRMFKKPVAAILHLLIYLGFLVINIEVLEIILDGILGTHRIFAAFLGTLYGLLIGIFELLAWLVCLTCVIFLCRRYMGIVPRLRHIDLKGWPRLDAQLILYIEILLMLTILSLDATDLLLQERNKYAETASFIFSQPLVPMFRSLSTSVLLIINKICWWTHIVGILSFAYYITYSKHLHIFMAFLNTYHTSLLPISYLECLPHVTKEVKGLLNNTPVSPSDSEPTRLGVKDVQDMSQKVLLEAFSCTECGRCTEVCPAHQTGKQLSPRKIMMAVRDRATEKAQYPENEKDLFHYISEEELYACTTCQACVEVCPIQINPMAIIVSLRQYLAMETSNHPVGWQHMYANLESNGAPWKFPAHTRADWVS